MAADGADQELFFRALEDVVILDHAADRLEVDEAFFATSS